MADNAATNAADYATTHGFKILRVAAGMRVKAFGELLKLEKELVSIIEAAGEKPTLNSAKYKAMLIDAQLTISDSYKLIAANHGASLSELAGIEWKASNAMVNRAVGVDIVSGKIPPKILEAVTKAPVILGHSSADWWNGQDADFRTKFAGEMAKGTLLGETTPELIKRLRGAGVFETPVAGSPQGLIKKAKRDAEALVLTSSATIANHARMESFKAKSDLIKGVQWLATLDSRTTPICMALDGKQWRFPDMKPVGHDKQWPGLTAHWRCRSTQISVLYSWEELAGKKLPSLDDATLQERVDQILESQGMPEEKRLAAKARARASMDGQVSKDHTYETWAKDKGANFIEQVLGPGRASLFNSGAMTFSDLTNQNNRPITLAQLEASIDTGEQPPETLGVDFLPPPVAPKYKDEAKAKAEAEALQAAKDAEAAAEALKKATLLAAMREVFIGKGVFTDEQLALWKRLPEDEKAVYMAEWHAAKKAASDAAKAAFQAKLAADKAAEDAIIAEKAAAEAAKQAAAKAALAAIEAKKQAEALAAAEAKAKKDAEEAAKKQAEQDAAAEAALLSYLAAGAAKGGAHKHAAYAAKLQAGKGTQAIYKAYNDALDASINDHLAAFEHGYNPADPHGPADPLIKKAYKMSLASPSIKGGSPLVFYTDILDKTQALKTAEVQKKMEKGIVKKLATIYTALNGDGGKTQPLSKAEDDYWNLLSQFEKKELDAEAELAAKALKAKKTKKADTAAALKESLIQKNALMELSFDDPSIPEPILTPEEVAFGAKLTMKEKKEINDESTKAVANFKAGQAAMNIPKPSSPAVIPASVTAPDLAAKNQDLYFPDPSGLTVIKSLPGSTAPKLVSDPQTGKQWVLKQGGGGAEHLKTEATADKLYRTMGASVPGSHFGESNGKPYKIAEYIEGVETLASWKQSASPAQIAAMHGELKKHFVMDALLANWDVAGLSNDNILVKNGKPIRIDNGGALNFRAQGSKKDAKEWSAKVLDLKGLRDAKKNPNTAEIFKGIKQSEIDDQIVAIVAKKAELVQIVEDAHGTAQAKILAARIDDLAKSLPATRQPAPEASAIVGDITFPPAFEAKAKTRFGTTMFAGGSELEDQQITVWTERDTSKNFLIKAQGTLTMASSRSFVSKLDALGLDTKGTTPPKNSYTPTPSNVHPEDVFWSSILAAAKTVSGHASDGKYNTSTIFAYNEIKKKYLAVATGTMDADKKAMLAHYGLAFLEIDKAIATQKPVGTALTQFVNKPAPVKAAPVALPPTDQAVVNGVTITRSATNRITYTKKKVVNGVLEDTGEVNRDVQTPAAYKLQRGNVEVTVVPYEVSPSSQRSYQGIVRINVKGTDPTTAIPEALAVLKDAGLIDSIQPTLAQKELVYLQKGFYLRDNHKDAEYVKIQQSGATDEEKVKAIKALAKTLYGVTLPDSPADFHRYYNPEGELPKTTTGARFWRRWDEKPAKLKAAEATSAFFHKAGDLEQAIVGWLTNGGSTTATVQRLRTGVGLAESKGGSSDSDLGVGGGNFFYTNHIKETEIASMGNEGIYFSGDSISRIDLASHKEDSFGQWEHQDGTKRRRTIAQVQTGKGIGYGYNTGLHKDGISLENVVHVKTRRFQTTLKIIDALKAAGVTAWPDGRKLEDVIIQ